MHYDSRALIFQGTRNVLIDDLIQSPIDGVEGAYGATVDHDADTDRTLNTLFLDFMGTFPNELTTEPVTLFEAVFKIAPDFQGSTDVNFSRNGGSIILSDARPPGFESQSVRVVSPPTEVIKATEELIAPDDPEHNCDPDAELDVAFPVSQDSLRHNVSTVSRKVPSAVVHSAEHSKRLSELSESEKAENGGSTTEGLSTHSVTQRNDDEPIGNTETLDAFFSDEFVTGIDTAR